MFHHCIDLHNISYGIIKSSPKYCGEDDFLKAYQWLEKEVGFYPLFLAVGNNINAYRITGYDNQWRRFIGIDPSTSTKIYRKASEFPNYVMFSWPFVKGVYTDYLAWHIVLNSTMGERGTNWNASEYEKKLIFKYSWNKAKWFRNIKQYAVQLVSPELDLRTANRIWVRNQSTKRILERLGFKNVFIKRLTVL